MAEKIVHEVLKEYYGQKMDAALIINNLKMFRIDESKKGNEQARQCTKKKSSETCQL